jgi:hypothetical protein
MKDTARRVAVAALVGSCFASSPAAGAQTGATLVAVVTAEPNASVTRRVCEELQALGVDVLVLKPPDEGSPARAPLEQTARSVGAVAAIRLFPSNEGNVEVWVADRVTGKAVVRELKAPSSGASDAAVAIGSVELLRASPMELHSAEAPRGEVAPTRAVEAMALRPRAGSPARLGLEAGAGAELGLRGLGPSADAYIDVSVRLAGHLRAGILGHSSVAPAQVSTTFGTVSVRSELFGAVISYSFVDESSAWVPGASVGVGLAHVSADGTAASPYVSASKSAWAAAPLAGLGLAWAFARGLRLRADGVAVAALPAVRVSASESGVGEWGAPAVLVTAGLEVLWGGEI